MAQVIFAPLNASRTGHGRHYSDATDTGWSFSGNGSDGRGAGYNSHGNGNGWGCCLNNTIKAGAEEENGVGNGQYYHYDSYNYSGWEELCNQ